MAKKPSLVDVFKEFLGADWFNTPAFPSATLPQANSRNTELAQYLATHGKPGPTLIPADYSREGAATEEPSFLNKTFDFLDTVTGARSARNIVDQFTDGEGNVLSDIGNSLKAIGGGVGSVANDVISAPLQLLPGVGDNIKGFSDKIDAGIDQSWNPDIRGSKIADNLKGMGVKGLDNDYTRSAVGLIAELALDPSMLIGGGLAKKGAEVGVEGALAAKAAGKAGDATPFIKPAEVAPEIKIPPALAAMRGGQAPGLINDLMPGRVGLPNPSNVQRAADFEKWIRREQQAIDANKGDARYSPEDGRRLGQLNSAQTNLLDTGSMDFYNGGGTKYLDDPLSELTRQQGLVKEFESKFPVASDEPVITNPDEIAYNILQDPVSMEFMKKAKKSDDGWRAAQKRWGRDPDVEQAHLDNAVSKAAWFEDMQAKKLAKAGKVTDGKGNISQISVARVLKNIEEGTIPRWGPEPAAAEGAARVEAIRAATKHVDDMLKKGNTHLNPANQANLYNKMYDATEHIFQSDPELLKKYGHFKGGPKLSPKEKKLAKAIENETNSLEAADIIKNVDKARKAKLLTNSEADNIRKYFQERVRAVNVNSPRARAARRVMARAMLRTGEDHLIATGAMPQYWDGTRVRLSDVLEEIGLEANDELATTVLDAWKTKDMRKIKEPAVAEAIYRSLARRPLHLSHFLEDMGDRAKQINQSIIDNYTPGKAAVKQKEMINDAEDVARRAGLTDEEIDAVKKLVANVVDVDKLPPEKFLGMLGARLTEAVAAGRVDADAMFKLQKEINKVLGVTKKELMTDISGRKFIDGFMLKFSTTYGRIPEMKRFSQDVMMWGERNAEARAQWLRNMVQAAGNNPDTVHAAFKVAQGMADDTVFADPAVQKLAAQMTDYFETMLGSSGMKGLMQDSSVATKSQIVMNDVNKHLKAIGSNFQFTNKAGVKDQFLGLTHDFSANGDGWVNSWKLANPKGAKQDPVSFLFDIDQAIERTVKEYTLIDHFGGTFGFRKGEVGFDPKIHTARLKSDRLPHDVYFTPQHRDMMQRLLHDIEDGLWRPQSKLMQHYARGLRVWKTGVTIYAPSHHIRNMIGDLHMMWWAGHNDPRNFIRSAKVLHAYNARYAEAMQQDSLDMLKGLVDKDAMLYAKTKPGDVILKQNGVQLTAEQIYVSAHQHGLLLDANKYEDIFGQAPLENLPGSGKLPLAVQKRIAEPLGGKAHHVAAKVLAENREHYVRLAHYVGAINKGLKKSTDLEKVMREAAHEVRKWHPDGRDMTNFEQKMRLAIPFYSWTRKALPLIVQSAAHKPSKVLYYPRTQMAMSELWADNENPTHLDPFPDNQLFPEWIRAKGVAPIFDPMSNDAISSWFGKLGRNNIDVEGNETGQVIANPSNPFNDVIESITGFGGSPLEIGKSVFDQTTPGIKIPGEMAMDQTFSGAPISDDKPGGKGVANYLFNQIPLISMGNNVAEFEFGDQKKPQGRETGMDIQALINYLTAAGIRGTGPYQTSAEFEARDRARK